VKGKIQDDPRKTAQIAEQEMFKLIEKELISGYEPGGEDII